MGAPRFYGGHETREWGYDVPDDEVTTTGRTICVDIHPGWDDNSPGEPRAMVVRVFDKDVVYAYVHSYCDAYSHGRGYT